MYFWTEPPPSGKGTGSCAAAGLDELTDEQLRVVARVEEGASIFYTGCAGTGKSFLLSKIVQRLYQLHGKKHVAVTASTGMAACNIAGCTLHSWAGE